MVITYKSAQCGLDSRRFRVQSILGIGGFGVVYRAFDREMHRSVALKTLHRVNADSLYRFKHEFRTLAAIVHPNLVRPFELIQEGANWYFSMEIVVGVDFLRWVKAAGEDMDARVGRLLDALAQLAAGIRALHAHGKVHRDIKPSNVLVTAGGRVVLLDLGTAATARCPGRRWAARCGWAGTPRYMAPEVLGGHEASQASDWYAVGVMLHEALSAESVSPSSAAIAGAEADAVGNNDVVAGLHAPGTPAALSALCGALLQADPGARAASGDIFAFVDALCAEMSLGDVAAICATSGGRRGRGCAARALREKRMVVVPARRMPPALKKSGDIASNAGVILEIQPRAAGVPDGVHGDGGGESIVLRGRCQSNESIRFRALDALMDALSDVLQGMDARTLAGWAGDGMPALVSLLPVFGRSLAVDAGQGEGGDREDAPSSERAQYASACRALRGILGGLALRQRVVVAIDHAEHGDDESAALLAELLQHPEAPPLTLVVAWREESAARSAFLTRLLPLAESLGAQPLGAGDLREIARAY